MSYKYLIGKFGKNITNIIVNYNINNQITYMKGILLWELHEWIKTYNYFTYDEYEGNTCEFDKYYFEEKDQIYK